MKVYLAAPWVHRDQMDAIAAQIEAAGGVITHKWWKVEVPKDPDWSAEVLHEFHKGHAVLDRNGVKAADLLFLINSEKSEGKSVEQGMAIAQNKPIFAVGKIGEKSNNVFHYLDEYRWFDDVAKACEALALLVWITKERA